jgi:hypothetical protein
MNSFKVIEFEKCENHMNRIVFEKYFHKSINISFMNKYLFIENKSKLCFEDRVTVKNAF